MIKLSDQLISIRKLVCFHHVNDTVKAEVGFDCLPRTKTLVVRTFNGQVKNTIVLDEEDILELKQLLDRNFK